MNTGNGVRATVIASLPDGRVTGLRLKNIEADFTYGWTGRVSSGIRTSVKIIARDQDGNQIGVR